MNDLVAAQRRVSRESRTRIVMRVRHEAWWTVNCSYTYLKKKAEYERAIAEQLAQQLSLQAALRPTLHS